MLIAAPMLSSASVALAWYLMSSPTTMFPGELSESEVSMMANAKASALMMRAVELAAAEKPSPPASGYES